jgi:hypothetical protein
VLLHEFGQDLVLALEFVLEGSELAVFGVGVGFAALAGVLEGSGAIVEELLLPEVEEVHGELVLLADVGDRLLLQEVETKQGDLLLRSEVTTLPSHECSSARVLPLTPPKASSSSD